MIDRECRDEFADAIEQFANGFITNDELEKSFLSSEDKAIGALFWYGAWHLFSDLEEHKIEDKHELSIETKEHIERWICFLRSDLPYEWPDIFWVYNFPGYILIFFTLGLLHFYAKSVIKKSGDTETWPFLSAEDYCVELCKQNEDNLRKSKTIKPPAEIDGATVLEWAWSGEKPFGTVTYDSKEIKAEIFGLAICKYADDDKYYRFSCNSEWETEQDFDYNSISEAKNHLPAQYREMEIIWYESY